MLALMHTQMAVGFPHSNSQPIPREVTQAISPLQNEPLNHLCKRKVWGGSVYTVVFKRCWGLFVGGIGAETKIYFSCVYIHIHKTNALV